MSNCIAGGGEERNPNEPCRHIHRCRSGLLTEAGYSRRPSARRMYLHVAKTSKSIPQSQHQIGALRSSKTRRFFSSKLIHFETCILCHAPELTPRQAASSAGIGDAKALAVT